MILININPYQERSHPSGLLKFILPYGLVMDYMTFQVVLKPYFMVVINSFWHLTAAVPVLETILLPSIFSVFFFLFIVFCT